MFWVFATSICLIDTIDDMLQNNDRVIYPPYSPRTVYLYHLIVESCIRMFRCCSMYAVHHSSSPEKLLLNGLVSYQINLKCWWKMIDDACDVRLSSGLLNVYVCRLILANNYIFLGSSSRYCSWTLMYFVKIYSL